MPLDTSIPIRFLRTAFQADDVVAIAFRKLPQGRWQHRFLTAEAACADGFQRWLRHLNADGHDLYVGMNAFSPGRRSRTETNIAAIRHVYLDFDSGGDEALSALTRRDDLPPPTYVVHSSPGKFQTIWNVRDFTPEAAKALLRHLAYTLGADPAVHDLARVLRLAGFRNYKYAPPPFVRLEVGASTDAHPPSAFPTPLPEAAKRPEGRQTPTRLSGTVAIKSQSERDWAFVMSGLSRGEPWQHLWHALVARRPDKPNPRFYASVTLLNALQSLGRHRPDDLVAELKAARSHQIGPLSDGLGPSPARAART
jgi:hypothetical protein